MTHPLENGGAQAVYDLWLGLIPQFFSPLGVSLPAGDKAAAFASNGAQTMDWLAPWAAAMPFITPATAKSASGDTESTIGQSMLAPWAAMLAPYPGAQAAANASAAANPMAKAMEMFAPWMAGMPALNSAGSKSTGSTTDNPMGNFAAGAAAGDAVAAVMQPLQATQQAWLDAMTRLGSVSPQSFLTGFDRTFGGLFDALGFGPMRKLQAACQDLAAASLAQNQSRAGYAMIVQGAFASGLERLMQQLAQMADAGERVESVLALLKMWAVKTEEAVHEVLQSDEGLAATAALTRAGLAHRRKLQNVASIVADSLDLTTRRELDEVYRELHELKRELRALRSPARVSSPAARAKPQARAGTNRRKTKP